MPLSIHLDMLALESLPPKEKKRQRKGRQMDSGPASADGGYRHQNIGLSVWRERPIASTWPHRLLTSCFRRVDTFTYCEVRADMDFAPRLKA